MNCPLEEKILELLEGDLPKAEVQEILTHVKKCKDCSKRLAEFKFLQVGLSKVLAEKTCVSEDDLWEYHRGTLPEEKRQELKVHIESCLPCQALLADWAMAEKTANEFFAQNLVWEEKAWKAAREIIAGFAKEGLTLYEQLWQRVRELISQKDQPATWNLAWVQNTVAGTLGAGAADPQAVMAMMTMLVAAMVAKDLEEGSIPADKTSIAQKARDYAQRIGAEKGLADHIQKVLPELLLES